jgi:hypothetical protein
MKIRTPFDSRDAIAEGEKGSDFQGGTPAATEALLR